MALTAVGTAAQQSVVLNRLSSHLAGLARIRRVLSGDDGAIGGRQVEESGLQVYTWQIPLKLLNGSE